ncbi:shikimate kinase [Leptospira sp. GIMC2001]|uniref:shikimate kinase n=1 Tax=Leptospira sp. GIMC2001 TaxID=1513297 RepID=UPI00234BA692|nr:shikimate kinase [Leptospira sp. GIMC2001]WCL47628.1 shikimate kinase [Leptospira sp. GIMC2001]
MNSIALIGPRGVGKSKISKRIGKKLDFPVLSTDSIAVYELGGISISQFVTEKCNGDWRAFRDLEFQILTKLENAKGIVLDCGGGIIFDLDKDGNEIVSERKLNLLRKIAKVVFLDDDVKDLVEKVVGDKSRPDLSKSEHYEQILKRRLPLYKDAAHYRLHLGGMKKEEAASRIVELVSY